MSIIESAFLKNLKDSKKELRAKSKEINSKTNYVPNTPVTVDEPKHEISSRKGIAAMSQKRKYSPKELNERCLISTGTKDRVLLNEYRNLRTKLIAGQSKKNFTTLVTSVVPEHDISLVVTNMAMAFALDSSKTSLIINADINNTNMEALLDIELDRGIIDYIETEGVEIDDILYETPISRLRYIPCGHAHEDISEYFTSSRMKNLVETLVERYPERFPMIVAPSIGSSADTRILMDLCDCVILVVPYGKCSETDIKHAMLTVGGEKFAGIILDDF